MVTTFKHTLGISVAAVLATGVVAGCGGSSSSSTTTKTPTTATATGGKTSKAGKTSKKANSKAGHVDTNQTYTAPRPKTAQKGANPSHGPLPASKSTLRKLNLFKAAIASAASYVGLSSAQLVTQLRGGSSMAQVAFAHHKTLSGMEAAFANGAKSAVNNGVAHGVITKQQAQAIEQRLLSGVARAVSTPRFGAH